MFHNMQARIQDFDDPSFDPFVSDEAAFGDHPDPYPAWPAGSRRGRSMRWTTASPWGSHPT